MAKLLPTPWTGPLLAPVAVYSQLLSGEVSPWAQSPGPEDRLYNEQYPWDFLLQPGIFLHIVTGVSLFFIYPARISTANFRSETLALASCIRDENFVVRPPGLLSDNPRRSRDTMPAQLCAPAQPSAAPSQASNSDPFSLCCRY